MSPRRTTALFGPPIANHRQARKFFWRLERARRAPVVALLALHVASRKFDILEPRREFSTSCTVMPRAAIALVSSQMRNARETAADLHVGHAVQHSEAIDDVAIRVIGQRHPIERCGLEDEPDDRIRVGIGFADGRLIDVRSTASSGARVYSVPNIIGGIFKVAFEREFDIDRGPAIAARC